MANTGSPIPIGRAGRRCRALTRGDLVTFLVAAMLCSASYCLGIWHNSRGAADSSVLGPSAVVAVPTSCGGGARADDQEPLDFEARHAAESAGLSVSATSGARRTTTSARRALPEQAVTWAGDQHPSRAAEAATTGGDGHRFTDAGAVRAFVDAFFLRVAAAVGAALQVGTLSDTAIVTRRSLGDPTKERFGFLPLAWCVRQDGSFAL
ncbi:hypothetical protein ACP70R_020983 [Stipagrostis hirtigluma subsp. patula]